MSWLSKLLGREKRGSKRHLSPPLTAFYWDGEPSNAHPVPDISQTGLFMRTLDRWSPRTLLRVTLQRSDEDSAGAEEAITLQCRVVRTGDDGVGMAIMFAQSDQSDSSQPSGLLATRKQFKKFIEQLLKDTTESKTQETPHLTFSVLGPIADSASANDQTAGQENPRQDDTK